jgi:hypothetical protein
MPAFLLILAQIVLVVCWYVVPVMATLPWWVIFLPAELAVVWIVCFVALYGAILIAYIRGL